MVYDYMEAAGTIDYGIKPIAQISENVKRLAENFLESVSFFGWLCYTYSATQFHISRLREITLAKGVFSLYLCLKRDEIVSQQ